MNPLSVPPQNALLSRLHELMWGAAPRSALARALVCGKLFHFDTNDGYRLELEAQKELLALHELISHRLFQILIGQHRGRVYSL